MGSTERLILVDGSSLIYRAYYAIPGNFRTSSGLHTNAIYGFATMFRKILSGRTPSHGAVIFDAPGKSFRAKKYPEYKSHRPRMDAELREQLEWIDSLVVAHNFPLLRLSGYEADDIIATLCKQARGHDMEVHIISADKDFAQLISEQVRMVDTLRDVVYTPELVKKKWGVPPHQFVDWQALVGDKADNIPGVPGIGAKGAAQLLERFDTLDEILQNTSKLKGRQKKNLEEFSQSALLSQELATLDESAPIDVGLEELRLTLPESDSLNTVYQELEFYSLLSIETPSAEHSDEDALKVNCVDTLENLAALAGTLEEQDVVAVLPLLGGSSLVFSPLPRWLSLLRKGRLGLFRLKEKKDWEPLDSPHSSPG